MNSANRLRNGAAASFLSMALFGLVVGCLLNGVARAQSADGAYRLGPGDRISIRVFGEEDLSMEVLLSATGTLTYPFLGEISIDGATVRELEDQITAGLKGPYLVNPEVSVAMVEYRPFFVHGEVVTPGGFPYQPRLTVERAIALAGGLTERGSRNKIEVIRESDESRTSQPIKLSDPVFAGDLLMIGQSFF